MLQPKKSLGQNFLRDNNILQKIIEAADLKKTDLILEVGPGEGILTEELEKKSGGVLAIEIDKNLAENLQKKFQNKKNIKIINADILKINIAELLSKNFFSFKKNYKVVANIPYYITSPIIRFFLENNFPPEKMILMIQKEVAERIVAEPGQMSLLSFSVQYYAKPELLFYVDKNSFFPVPEVDSAVIKISAIKSIKNKEEVKNFFRIARIGFSAKRKTLVNNLSNGLHLPKKETEEKIKLAGLKINCRAQELSLEDWKKLEKILQN
jgi:16S rRNA (adenine1518-N6/adenine1519-N6)-dimethyltransferase